MLVAEPAIELAGSIERFASGPVSSVNSCPPTSEPGPTVDQALAAAGLRSLSGRALDAGGATVGSAPFDEDVPGPALGGVGHTDDHVACAGAGVEQVEEVVGRQRPVGVPGDRVIDPQRGRRVDAAADTYEVLVGGDATRAAADIELTDARDEEVVLVSG